MIELLPGSVWPRMTTFLAHRWGGDIGNEAMQEIFHAPRRCSMAAWKAAAVLPLQVPVYKLINRLPGHGASRCVGSEAVRFSSSQNGLFMVRDVIVVFV